MPGLHLHLWSSVNYISEQLAMLMFTLDCAGRLYAYSVVDVASYMAVKLGTIRGRYGTASKSGREQCLSLKKDATMQFG